MSQKNPTQPVETLKGENQNKTVDTIFPIFKEARMYEYMLANGFGEELVSSPFKFKGKIGAVRNIINLKNIFKGEFRKAERIYG